MRDMHLRMEDLGISANRYKELLYFCRQYDEKKSKAAALLGVQGSCRITYTKDAGDVLPTGKGSTSDMVARAAEKREKLMEDVSLIEDCTHAICEGRYHAALIKNVCQRVPFEKIDPSAMPSVNRESFFNARRQFFVLLDLRESARHGEPL